MVAKSNLECDIMRKRMQLIARIAFQEAVCDLVPYQIVGSDETSKIFGYLKVLSHSVREDIKRLLP